jgi:cell division ATPase FtsA
MANPQAKDNLLIAIDVGSAKTCVLAAEVTEAGLRYRGHGIAESRGSRKGVIVDLARPRDQHAGRPQLRGAYAGNFAR